MGSRRLEAPILRRLAPAALVVAAALLVVAARDRLGRIEDEGVVSYSAERVLEGRVPYRDFWHYAAPGTFYLYAGAYRAFGTTAATARGVAAAVGLGVLLLLYRTARRFLPDADAALFAAAYGLVSLPIWPVATYHWPSTLAALLAAEAFLAGRPGLCGAAAALTAATHQGKGALLLGGIALAAAVGPRPGAAAARRALLRGAAGAAMVAAPVLAFLHAEGALRPLVAQTLLLTENGSLGLPYFGDSGGPLWPRLGAVLVAYGAPAGLAWGLWRGVRRPAENPALAPAAALGASLWASALYRPDGIHLLFSSPLAALVAYRGAVSAGPRAAAAVRLAAAYAAAVAAILFAWNAARWVDVPTRRGLLREAPGSEGAAWVAAVEARVPPGGRTFLFPYASGVYFLAGVRNATSFEVLKPGVQNTEAHVARALAELEADPPAYVFDGWGIWRTRHRAAFPAAPARVFAVHPLADFLVARYEPETSVAGMLVWRRRDAPEGPPVQSGP